MDRMDQLIEQIEYIGRLLIGWKEIAEELRCSISTAQRRAKKLQFPTFYLHSKMPHGPVRRRPHIFRDSLILCLEGMSRKEVEAWLLVGWKEIAGELRCSVKTAQNRAKRWRLPIFYQHIVLPQKVIKRMPCMFRDDLVAYMRVIGELQREGKIPK